VRNAGTVWLSMTLGCAECHDHKFDPVATKEFYRFAAFFADIKEKAVGRQDQTLLASAEQQAKLKQIDDRLGPASQAFNANTPELEAAQNKLEALVKKEGKGLAKDIAGIVALDPAK